MRDFLGRILKIGDYAIYPGKGNGTAEYGLILMKIVKVSSDSVTAERLDIDYLTKKVLRKKTNIKALSRLVVIEPPAKMIYIFINPDNHFDLVSAWLHGRQEINWETLTIGKMRD